MQDNRAYSDLNHRSACVVAIAVMFVSHVDFFVQNSLQSATCCSLQDVLVSSAMVEELHQTTHFAVAGLSVALLEMVKTRDVLVSIIIM